MSDPGLSTLLSTKAAFDLGLISDADFESVRAAYVRAQQIKAAVDVGLLSEEDFASAKAAFLHGIAAGHPPGAGANGVPAGASRPTRTPTVSRPGSPVRVSRPASAAPPSPLRSVSGVSVGDYASDPQAADGSAHGAGCGAANGGAGHGLGSGAANGGSAHGLGPGAAAGGSSSALGSGAAAFAALGLGSLPPSAQASGSDLAAVGVGEGGSRALSSGGGAPLTRSDLPATIPKIGGFRPKQSGTSMSGIRVDEEAVDLFYVIRSKATYAWATWRLDEAGTSIVIDLVGPKNDSFEHFLAALPSADCRYGVFDYASPTAAGTSKLVFLNWSPDSARIKAKMMYASSKDFFKGHLDGISVEFQASEPDDITEQQVAEAVAALKRV